MSSSENKEDRAPDGVGSVGEEWVEVTKNSGRGYSRRGLQIRSSTINMSRTSAKIEPPAIIS